MRRVCGNFSFQLPRIKSRGSQALIQFRSDWSDNYGGFSAAVRFTAGERQGCGGIVNLTETSQVQLRAPDVAVNPRNDRIEGELDCQWTVLTLPGKVIRFQLTQIDMAATTASGNCDDDYLELRENRTHIVYALFPDKFRNAFGECASCHGLQTSFTDNLLQKCVHTFFEHNCVDKV